MPALFVFLLKVNIALIVFCLGYFLLLRKLTFYTLNRIYLVLGIIFSSVYPFVNLEGFMEQHSQLAPIQQAVLNLKAPTQNLEAQAWYWNWALMIFWIGSAFFAMRLLVQFISLYRIYRSSTPDELLQYNVRITEADVSPFAFWQTIFINPENIETADLKSILQHEQVHVNEWHTLDILLAETSLIFYWFNPGIWFMKKAVSENIEFITDRKILENGLDSKAYQYSLLNLSLGCNASPGIVNHFNFSTLKKRIQMMNARRSSKINLSRYALLVPTMIVCLCVFSISKADIVDKGRAAYHAVFSSANDMSSTIHEINEVVIKSKKKAHKPVIGLNDTTKKLRKNLIVHFTDADTTKGNRTFTIKADTIIVTKPKDNKSLKKVLVFNVSKDSSKTYTINAKNVNSAQVKSIPASTVQQIRIIDSKDTSASSKNKIIKIETKKQ